MCYDNKFKPKKGYYYNKLKLIIDNLKANRHGLHKQLKFKNVEGLIEGLFQE